jgi:hypothetical protein
MARVSGWLWIALAGTVLLFVSLGTNFYLYEGEARDAWFGVAHASEFLLATGLVTIVLTALMATGRSLVRGRTAGIIIGVMGAYGSLHVVYRMFAPPFEFELGNRITVLSLFDSCLGFCNPAQAADVSLLPGIWIALAGSVAVAIGGFLHAFSARAKVVPANFWRATEQTGMSPWLGLAGLGAVGQWLFGYTVFTFYIVGGETEWSGWFPTPHTSVMVIWSTLLVVGLVVAASRRRAPMSPAALGGVIALLGFFSGSRILYRMIEPPFGGGTAPAEIGIGAFLALASAVVIVVSGAVYAATHRQPIEPADGRSSGTRSEAETRPGPA